MAEYIEYHPLKFWLDPASIAEIVAHIQTYLVNNPINSTTEIETIIHDYLIAHPELIGGVESVNGETGEVVLTADNISGGENVTIKDVLDSLQDQIDEFENAVNGERIDVHCVYEQGSLSVIGVEEDHNKRVRSNFVNVADLSSISFAVKNGYRYFLFWYDENKAYKTRTDTWQTSMYNLATSTYPYMRWVLATINDATALTPDTVPDDALVITASQHTRIDDNANAIKNMMQSSIGIGITGEGEAIVSAPDATNTVRVVIPSRLFVYGYSANPQAFESTGGVHTLSHNDVLYLNLITGSVVKTTVSSLASVADKIVIIAYNNKGRIMGAFSSYQQRVNNTSNFATTIFCNRQGDIGGCPVNSNIGFKLAKDSGYNRVRGSLCYTADGVGVMWHDRYLNEHIDNNKVYDSNGNVVTTAIDITALTYAELQTYDFGKDRGYDGLQITTFEDFVKQAVTCGYEIDVELKFGLSTANIENAFDIVALNGMASHCLWIGDFSNLTYINKVLELNPYASVAFGTTSATDAAINQCIALKNGTNDVWLAITRQAYPDITNAMRKKLVVNGIRVKYCSLYTTSLIGITDAIKTADMVEIAYLKNPSWYFTHTNRGLIVRGR